jgi:hypothetical protein
VSRDSRRHEILGPPDSFGVSNACFASDAAGSSEHLLVLLSGKQVRKAMLISELAPVLPRIAVSMIVGLVALFFDFPYWWMVGWIFLGITTISLASDAATMVRVRLEANRCGTAYILMWEAMVTYRIKKTGRLSEMSASDVTGFVIERRRTHGVRRSSLRSAFHIGGRGLHPGFFYPITARTPYCCSGVRSF